MLSSTSIGVAIRVQQSDRNGVQYLYGAIPPPPLMPDLVVTSLRAATSATIGSEISVTETQVRNSGSASAGPFRVGFYFSTDSTITTGDVDSGWGCTFDQVLAAGAIANVCASGPIGVPSSLSPGTYYLGVIADNLNQVAELSEGNNGHAADTGPVTLSGGQTLPQISNGGIVNGASFSGLPPAVGTIASLFGSNLGSSTQAASSVPLPTSLGGVIVRVNNIAAPLFFVSPGQINFQIPWEVLGQSQVSVTVSVGNLTSTPAILNMGSYSPGLFSTNSQGTGQGAVLITNSDTLVAPVGSIPGRTSRPASVGEYITIYCTGLGNVTNRPASGAVASANPLSHTLTTVSVTIGGVPATVSFSGLAPGFVGLYQVNVQVPANAATGNAVPMVLNIGGTTSNLVTIAVNIVNCTVPGGTPNDTTFISFSRTFNALGEWYTWDFTLFYRQTVVLRFASDFKADAAIVASTALSDFRNNRDFFSYEVFDDEFGYRYVTLNAGTYYVGARNQVSGINNIRLELDYDIIVPGATFNDFYFDEATNVGAHGLLWQPFTIQCDFRYLLDGANSGVETYLIRASELDNFRNYRSFSYYID